MNTEKSLSAFITILLRSCILSQFSILFYQLGPFRTISIGLQFGKVKNHGFKYLIEVSDGTVSRIGGKD